MKTVKLLALTLALLVALDAIPATAKTYDVLIYNACPQAVSLTLYLNGRASHYKVESGKPLKLRNAHNSRTLQFKAWGGDTDAWIGRQVERRQMAGSPTRILGQLWTLTFAIVQITFHGSCQLTTAATQFIRHFVQRARRTFGFSTSTTSEGTLGVQRAAVGGSERQEVRSPLIVAGSVWGC